MEELYPPQEGAVEEGVLEGENLTLSVPTASGKTLVAEMAVLNSLLSGGRALYIVPLRALASEKYETFSEYEELGLDVAVSTGDFDESGEWLSSVDLVVATSEKVDSLLRNGASWLRDLDVVVLDEVHLVDDGERGPTLEMVVAHLKDLNPGAQFLALSATISNADEIGDWLGSTPVVSDWRPVELRKGVLFGSALNFEDGREEVDLPHRDPSIGLALEAVDGGDQSLVFASSRREAESAARRCAEGLDEGLPEVADEIRGIDDTETSRELAAFVESGAAFHHAGLSWKHRAVVEREFRDRRIKVVAATPTLAMGVNMPARRVVVKSYRRYDGTGMSPIPVMEVHQMFGRAGRPGLDEVGEALLVAKSLDETEELMEHYVEADPEKVFSKLASLPALRKHLLALVSLGSLDRGEAMDFLEGTLYSVQSDTSNLGEKVDSSLDFLREEGFLVEGDGLAVTETGRRVAQLYIDPKSASKILEGLEKASRRYHSEIGLLHLVCSTPDIRPLYLRKSDEKEMNRFLSEKRDELLYEPGIEGYEEFLSDLKVARMLLWWIDERGEDAITEEFGVGPGDLRHRVETAEWLLHGAAELAALEGRGDVKEELETVHERIKHGIKEELLELVELPGVGRVRGRSLFERGYRTAAEVMRSSEEELAQVEGLGQKTARKVKEANNEEGKDAKIGDFL